MLKISERAFTSTASIPDDVLSQHIALLFCHYFVKICHGLVKKTDGAAEGRT